MRQKSSVAKVSTLVSTVALELFYVPVHQGMAVASLESRMLIRAAEAEKRKQLFLVCRYTLILATSALILSEIAKDSSPLPLVLLVSLAIASNLALGRVEPFGFFDPWMQAPVIISDTAMISTSLLLARASQESFLFFFFLLIMAAKLESLVTLGICASAIGFASFLLGAEHTGWASPTLMRVPFSFATGLFFGYVVLPERSGQMYPFYSPPPPPGHRPVRKLAPPKGMRASAAQTGASSTAA